MIAAPFDEAEARDPQHQRCWVVLVDGAAHQLELIQKEADRRAVTIHIVLDIVHVIEKLSAPRGALSYPPCSGERLEDVSLGLMAYLDSKGKGDSSMPGNRWPPQTVRGGAPGGPRNMAKAELPEAESPAGAIRTPAGKPSETGVAPCDVFHSCTLQPPGSKRCPVRTLKEMSRPPKLRSIRMTETNVGSPTGCESYGDRVPVVVAGVTTCQGGREGRPQGQGAQVTGPEETRRYAQCRTPKRYLES